MIIASETTASEAVHEILKKYNLDWRVKKEPLVIPTDDGYRSTPFYATVRQDTGLPLGICSSQYSPYQNSELAELLIRLSEQTGFTIHNGGLLKRGKKVYIQLDTGNQIPDIGTSHTQVKGFLTGMSSHDGTIGVAWGNANITIICQNAFHVAYKSMDTKIKHSTNMRKVIENEMTRMEKLIASEQEIFLSFKKFDAAPLSDFTNIVPKLVQSLTGVDTTLTEEEIENQYSSYAINRTGELVECIAHQIDEQGETLWGLFSGVTKYTSHVIPAGRSDTGREESLMLGQGQRLAFKAFQELIQASSLF